MFSNHWSDNIIIQNGRLDCAEDHDTWSHIATTWFATIL